MHITGHLEIMRISDYLKTNRVYGDTGRGLENQLPTFAVQCNNSEEIHLRLRRENK